MNDASTTPAIGTDAYDQAFRALHDSRLVRELWAEAMGEQYPEEVDPFSSCCWWLLGQVVAGLRSRPGGTVVDLGCGRGGPGLWLARALSARLVGIDISPVAIELARSRAPQFLAGDRASFHVAEFSSTGLEPATADAVVSIDALPFAPDVDAALREIHRILPVGGRLVFTAAVRARRGGGERPSRRGRRCRSARPAGSAALRGKAPARLTRTMFHVNHAVRRPRPAPWTRRVAGPPVRRGKDVRWIRPPY